MPDDDRSLRDHLRAADPARDLVPASSTWITHRMEHIMTEHSTPTTRTASARPSATKRWMLVGAATAGLLVAAAVVVPLVVDGAGPTLETLKPALGGDPATSSCLVLEPATIAAQEQAFAATVLDISGNTVVLEVTERFAGDVADQVEVSQVAATAADFSGVPFETGQSYLIAANGGTISSCGVTGVDSPELRAVYDEAFPR